MYKRVIMEGTATRKHTCIGQHAAKGVKIFPEKVLKVWISSLPKCSSCELSANPSTLFSVSMVALKYWCTLITNSVELELCPHLELKLGVLLHSNSFTLGPFSPRKINE